MLNTLFESLDETVFTPELVESLEARFNEAVKEKVDAEAVITESRILESVKAEHLQLLEESKAEQMEQLKEEFDSVVDTLHEKVSSYIDTVVEKFITEHEEAINAAEVNANAEAMVEAFDAMLLGGGVTVAEIHESKSDNKALLQIEELKSQLNAAINEAADIASQNDEIVKTGLISEMKEGLTIVQADKFETLAEMLNFEKSEGYLNKLEILKESVKGESTKVDVTDVPAEPAKLNESTETVLKASGFKVPSHLV